MKKILLLLLLPLMSNTSFAQTEGAPPGTLQTGVEQNNDKKDQEVATTDFTQDPDKMEIDGMLLNVYVRKQTDKLTKYLVLSKTQSKYLYDANKKLAMKTYNAAHMTDAKEAEANKAAIERFRKDMYQGIFTKVQYDKWLKMPQPAMAKKK